MCDDRMCRFCQNHAPEGKLVRYGVRAYAHPVCLFRRRGEAGIRALHAWQIEQLPVIPLARAGLSFERLTAILDAHPERARAA